MFYIKDKNQKEIHVGNVLKSTIDGTVAEVKFGYSEKLGITGWYVENASKWFTQPLNPTDGNDQNNLVEIIGTIKEASLETYEKLPPARSGYGKNFNVIH